MTEYNKGDLVEAVKGDRVLRARFGGDDNGLAGLGFQPWELELLGFTVTLIEKAAPALPTEPGIYVRWIDAPSPTIVHKITDGRWVDANDSEYLAESYVAKLSPLTRLEPVADTAKKVLAAVNGQLESASRDYYQSRLDKIAAEFGVTN